MSTDQIVPGSRKAQPLRSASDVLLRGDPSAWVGWNPEVLDADEAESAWRRTLCGPPGDARPHTTQLYVHFPLCRMSCRFCQYWHLLARDESELDGLSERLVRLIARHGGERGRARISNAYFGGGTPTAMSARSLRRVLDALRRAFHVAHEHTSEGHPQTLDDEKLDVLAEGGVNRLSFGVQSFDERVLATVGRSNGSAHRAKEIVHRAQRLGMAVNVDLIAGLPAQTPESFAGDLACAMRLGTDTITVYRYQPVHRLPTPPAPELQLDRLLHRNRVPALRRGYVLGPARAEAYSAMLVRAHSRAARKAGQIIWGTISDIAGLGPLRRYTDVDRSDLNLLGIGPGAISHLVGFGWYRDVTAPRGADVDTVRLWGTRMTPDDEARSSLLIGLASAGWAKAAPDRLPRSVAAHLERAAAQGVLRRWRSWVRWARGADADARDKLLRALVPERPEVSMAAKRRMAFQMRKDVEDDLVDMDGDLM